MTSHLKAELAATCSALGRLHRGEYLIEPDCIESVKDLIRYLKRDDESHQVRRYLGESEVLQNDLIHIIKSCPEENSDLFDVTLRLLINLTTPAILLYRNEIPAEKVGRNIYLSLMGYEQCYKIAFCDVEFWSKVCGKLTYLFEIDLAERSEGDGIQIERILLLLRNVLQIPADEESEKRPENDLSVHDKVLWALRQSQILELLLFLSANRNEEHYFLNLLEIFSLVLREQNPKVLTECDVHTSGIEKAKDTENLIKVRESEKCNRYKYRNARSFNGTFVVKGIKSFSNKDVVCHKFTTDKADLLTPSTINKKQVRTRKNLVPIESEEPERRSTFSTRVFLKELCLEFLTCSFSGLMNVVKREIVSGKSLTNDQYYYLWALKFFVEFTVSSNLEATIIQDLMSTETFHFIQTRMDDAFEHLAVEKKKTADWVKRIHLILKAYHSILEALLWMDCSKNVLARSLSRELKSQIFIVTEYREMILHVLLQYDATKFSIAYLRDLIETAHLFVKLLEEYARQTKMVIQKVVRKKSKAKKNKQREENREKKWEKIKDHVYDILCSKNQFPEIPPFDAALEISIDNQKERAMKNIQKLLHLGNVKDGIGLLRSARQVWPENEFFGSKEMSVEDEKLALKEIFFANLSSSDCEKVSPESGKKGDFYEDEEVEEELNEEEEEEEKAQKVYSRDQFYVLEKEFDIMEYKKRLVNKKIIEGCGTLLKNYQKNSDRTNHCIIKFLYRIGWECCMPAMLYQASLFWTLLKILQDKKREYSEINTFTINLLRRFRKHATKHPMVFLDLLFWKDCNVASEIQLGYEAYPIEQKATKHKKNLNKIKEKGRSRGKKHQKTSCMQENDDKGGRKTGRKKIKKPNPDANLSASEDTRSGVVTENESDSPVLHERRGNEIIFENSSESDDYTIRSTVLNKKCTSGFVSTDFGGNGRARIRNTYPRKKPNEDVEKQGFGLSRCKFLNSDEGRDKQNRKIQKYKDSRKFLNSQRDLRSKWKSCRRILKGNEKNERSKWTQSSNHCKNPFYSTSVHLLGQDETKEDPKSQLDESNLNKSSDHNFDNQTLKNKKESEIFDEEIDKNNYLKSKRIRYFNSDSDHYPSDDEELVPRKTLTKRRKFAVIDSGSDIEEEISDK